MNSYPYSHIGQIHHHNLNKQMIILTFSRKKGQGMPMWTAALIQKKRSISKSK